MAGHISHHDPLDEDQVLLNIPFTESRCCVVDNVTPTSNPSPTQITAPASIAPRDAAITTPPVLSLEQRQNNPQDCQNLIIASVNRATVQISRTIIQLNATFSQQLNEARISASNGIKSAQNSASAVIASVSSRADIATSSAFSSLTIANKRVVDASAGLTDAQASASSAIAAGNSSLAAATSSLTSLLSASSSDVSSLSASLSAMQAVITAAQSALATVTGSSAAEASALLASAASAIQAPSHGKSAFPGSQTPLLTRPQIAGIVIAAVIILLLLALSIYLLMRILRRRQERDSYLQEKNVPGTPRNMNINSRMSSMVRTGNGITIRFNPLNSSDAKTSSPAVPKLPERFQAVPSPAVEKERSQVVVSETEVDDTKSSHEVSARLPVTRGFGETRRKAASRVAHDNHETKEEVIGNTFTKPRPTRDYQNVTASSDLPQGKVLAQAAALTPTVLKSSKQTPEVHTNPFDDPTNAQSIEVQPTLNIPPPVPPKPPQRRVHQKAAVVENLDENGQPLDPFRDIQPKYLSQALSRPATPRVIESGDPLKSKVETPIGLPVVASVDSQVEPSETPRPTEFTLEDLLPPQTKRVPRADILKMLNEEEVRNSEVPEIDELIRKVAKENGGRGNEKLFWTDIRASQTGVEEVTGVPLLEEEKPVLETEAFGPAKGGQEAKEIVGEEDRVLSPVVRSPKTNLPHIRTDIPSPSQQQKLPTGPPQLPPRSPLRERYQILPLSPSKRRSTSSPARRKLSPRPRKLSLPDSLSSNERGLSLRRDPSKPRARPPLTWENSRGVEGTRIGNITSVLAEAENAENVKGEETKGEDRVERGRSMLRMSDIIDAKRMSTGTKNDISDVDDPSDAEKRMLSPLRRNPVNQEVLALVEKRAVVPLRSNSVDQQVWVGAKSNTLSPLRRNSTTKRTEEKRARSLTPPPKPLLSPPSMPQDRELSPLRRNPSTAAKRKSRSLSPTRPPALTSNTTAINPREILPAPVRNSVLQHQNNPNIAAALNKFRVLDERGPRERVEAESEVTIRARAGIYIPGSLREKAVNVRDVSKARSMGPWEMMRGSG